MSDYYGCEWPDSVIVVNNIMYWISPTRSGEVVAFDGTQLPPVSLSLAKTSIIARSRIDKRLFSIHQSTGSSVEGGITATNGENIFGHGSALQTAANEFRTASPRQPFFTLTFLTGRFWVFHQVSKSNETR